MPGSRTCWGARPPAEARPLRLGREKVASHPAGPLRRADGAYRHHLAMSAHTNPGAATSARRFLLGLGALGLALSMAACGGAGTATNLPGNLSSIAIPTFPPDDLASGLAACIDAPTMAIIDQLRAPGADVPALLAANKDKLISGLSGLESADPKVTEWRDALLQALSDGDMNAAAAQIAALAANQVQLTPC